jgi:hypothetical protein
LPAYQRFSWRKNGKCYSGIFKNSNSEIIKNVLPFVLPT